ncbi:MAG: carboxypeptidase regulatory-like domain-containing protein [Chlorobi bacterium]|nr:carboxypeptidase regulatory-like domain-containing protein [Chlorobiota bacterium]
MMRRLLSLAVLGMIVLVAAAVAGVPSKPREFSASGGFTNTVGQYKVVLQWLPSQVERDADRPTGYYVYRAVGQTENLSQYSRIATVSADSNVQQVYTYTDQPLQEGTYSYFITAYNSDGESPRTNIRVVTLPPNTPPTEWIRFVTSPPQQGRVGVQYRYEARAESRVQGVTIRYQLMSGPDGMTIDESTGLVTWTPQRTGTYRVAIKATIQVQGMMYGVGQEWSIIVSEDEEHENCILVEGIVIDTSNTPMSAGIVVAYRAITRNNEVVWIVASRAEVGDAGTFHMRLPAGRYKFVTEGRDYRATWYENSTTADSARVLEFQCGTDSTVDLVFVVIPREHEQFYVVSGRVTSAETGNGVSAWVKFMTVSDNHRDNRGNDWGQGATFTAETNADGYYEIRLSNRYTYIARAIPRSDDYVLLYFDGTTNIAEATRIALTGPRDGVNFALPTRPARTGGFSGRITDSVGNGVAGWAIACRLIATNSDRGDRIRRFRTVETDSLGNYQFTGLERGVYVVLGIPRSRDYVPGFCVQGDFATLRWRNATRIEVGDAMLDAQYAIKLRARTRDRGIVRLDGWVRGRSERIKRGGSEQADQPVAGALIAIVTDVGISGYAISQDDGYYAITELMPGNGTLVVSHPDYESAEVPIVIAPAVSAQSQDVGIDPVQASTVTDEQFGTVTVAPNPASSTIRVVLEQLVGTARIEIVTLVGTVVAQYEMSAQQFELSTDGLGGGLYVVRITTAAGVHTVPVVIVR